MNHNAVLGSDVVVQQWLNWTAEKLIKPTTPAPPPVKHDWYQTESQVCVNILAKNLDPSKVLVDFSMMNVS